MDLKTGHKKLFVCHHPTLNLQVGLVGGNFVLFWWRFLFLFPGLFHFLIQAWLLKKKPLYATIVIITSDKALVNQCTEGIQFN